MQKFPEKRKKSIFDIIIDIVIILLALLVIYWGLQLIFGGSPEITDFIVAILILLGGLVFKVYRDAGELKVEQKYISIGVRESFNRIKGDMNLLKEHINLMKKDISLIKNKLKA